MKMLKTSPMTVFHQHTEDKDEAEADADARTTKFELDPSLVFNPATENDDEDVEDELDNGVSSSSVVFRSIRPIKCSDNYEVF